LLPALKRGYPKLSIVLLLGMQVHLHLGPFTSLQWDPELGEPLRTSDTLATAFAVKVFHFLLSCLVSSVSIQGNSLQIG